MVDTWIEQYPPEIDVYKVPHDRMKELVNVINEKLPAIQESINFDDDLETTLENIYTTIWELKNHEIIENTVIMSQLKERLLSRQVYNKSVCNCHEDSELIKIIDLVEMVYSSSTENERNFYWHNLQEALYDFLDDFLPHMEEEENTFQPLLNQYFNYEELKEIQETVINKHEEWTEKLNSGEKSLKRFKRDSESLDAEVKEQSASDLINQLPDEILQQIFSLLEDPRDLSRVSGTCIRWNSLSRFSSLWMTLPLSQWERDIWTWKIEDLEEILETEAVIDELDADDSFYHKILEQVKLIGHKVSKFSICGSKSASNYIVKSMLLWLPNIKELNFSYTNICHSAFDDCNIKFLKLTKLDLSGCHFITDHGLKLLFKKIPKNLEGLRWISLSGCVNLTDEIFNSLQRFSKTLVHIDFSGCSRLSGPAMRKFIECCPNIELEEVSYCSLISDGPSPEISNGCSNQDCSIRICCLNYRN